MQMPESGNWTYIARMFVEDVELEARAYDGSLTEVGDQVYDTMLQEALDAGFDVADIHVTIGNFNYRYA